MARKIRLAGLTISILVLIAGLIAVCAAAGHRIGDVKSFVCTNSATNSVSVKWNKIGSADGYYIYQKNGETYKKIAKVKDPTVNKFNIKNLDDSTNFSFAIKGYKNVGKKLVVSKNYAEIKACTIPLKQSIFVSTPDEGAIELQLTENPNSGGYEIQYSTSKDFKDAQSDVIKNTADTKKVLSKLNIGDTYYFRARSYVYFGEKQLFGQWSKVASQKALSLKELTKIDTSKPMIAITFDDGPGYNGASDKILDVIEKYHIKATFFMVGNNAADHSKNVKRKVKLGCELGNHTVAHAHYGSNVTPKDISKATELIEKASGGAKVTAFRSTGGNTTSTIRNECKKEGLPLYYWSLDTEDWKSRNADSVYKKVMNNVQNGDIILMHDIYDSTAEAFERMVPELIKKGYQFVTCQELIEAQTGKKPKAGTQYMNGTTIKNETR